MQNKTHYRNVFKSDHLSSADLEELTEQGKRLVFTIKEVKQYVLTSDRNSGIVVAGKRISANIAHFKEDIKPMVINATNGKVIRNFAPNHSPMVEDWGGIVIELYIDPTVKMKGDIVGGIRVKPTQPTLTKPELTPEMVKDWQTAVSFCTKTKSIAGVLKQRSLSKENQLKLSTDAGIQI